MHNVCECYATSGMFLVYLGLVHSCFETIGKMPADMHAIVQCWNWTACGCHFSAAAAAASTAAGCHKIILSAQRNIHSIGFHTHTCK